MTGYEIFFKDSVYKDLRSVPKTDLKKILSRIKQLSEEPRPIGSQKITSLELYRVRQGQYRIVYSIQDAELIVHVVKVGQRKEIYR